LSILEKVRKHISLDMLKIIKLYSDDSSLKEIDTNVDEYMKKSKSFYGLSKKECLPF
jgi:hypothetical protein